MNADKRIIVNVHIEKTAGTSLLKFFEHTLGRNRIAFYDPNTDSVIKDSDLFLSPANDFIDKYRLKSYAFWPIAKKAYLTLQSRKRMRNKVPANISIVHGHFRADRFSTILPDAITTIVLRDPLSRMYSQYVHWKRARGRCQWRIMIRYDSKMTFEDFALLPMLQNYQLKTCAGHDLHSFKVVGITEKLDTFMTKLTDLFYTEGHITKIQPLNEFKALNQQLSERAPLQNGFEKTFYNYHKEDYDLYNQAKQLV